jgi:MFS family permease
VKAWRNLKFLPRELWILCLASLVNRMGTMALPFLVLYLTRGLGYSAGAAGAVLAVYGAVALIVGPIAGKFSDRWGPLRMLEGSLLASGVVLLLFPLAHSMPAIVVMTVLFSATNESFRPASYALVGELAPPEHRKAGFALSRLAVNLGMSIGPALGGFLAQKSFTLLFLVDGLTTVAAVAILYFSSFHTALKAAAPRAAGPPPGRLFNSFFNDAKLRVFLLGILPVSLVFFQHQSSMPLFLVRDLHFTESAYGLLFTVNCLMIIALEIPLNSATAHWSYRRTLSLGSLLFALGYGGLCVARSFAEVMFTVVIWTFGEMILFPSMSAYVSDLAPDGRRGEYMGMYLMAFSVAFMAGPWIGTLALDHFGPTAFWAGTLGVGLVSTFALFRTGGPPLTGSAPR